jgi:hypothetical protein
MAKKPKSLRELDDMWKTEKKDEGALGAAAAIGGIGCAGLLLYLVVVIGFLASLGLGAGAAVLLFRWVTGF